MIASVVVLATSFALLIDNSLAGSFLGATKFKVEDIEASFLAELADGLGKNPGLGVQRLDTLEEALRPVYASVPQENDGTLSHNVVRYALQRFFARRHGWYIRGLGLGNGSLAGEGDVANASEIDSQAMQEWVPVYLQGFLEKMTGGRGVNLRELAVFAATLEDLIHKEEEGHLVQAYASQNLSPTASMEQKVAFEVLKTYMMIYMQGGNWTSKMAANVEGLKDMFLNKVSHWSDTLDWLKQLLKNNTEAKAKDLEPGLDFQEARKIVGQIGDRYGAFNDGECGRLKVELVALESAKPGRVRLVDFYKKGLDGGAWEFSEKIEFLRDIGTLDESDPSTPLVILPNYVQARTNCLSVSDFYAVCCKNECEGLMERLEGEIVNSTARPSQVAKVVSKLSSDTIAAPRKLSKSLMQRLQDVASKNGGEVPLHGRLFALWMHHAFPRECPYPHASGTTNQQTEDEWMLRTGQVDSRASRDEMMREVASSTCRLLPKGMECTNGADNTGSEQEDEELPWDSEEELLVVRSNPPSLGNDDAWRQSTPLNPVGDAVRFAALASTIYGFFWALTSTPVGMRVSQVLGLPLPTASLAADKCCCV